MRQQLKSFDSYVKNTEVSFSLSFFLFLSLSFSDALFFLKMTFGMAIEGMLVLPVERPHVYVQFLEKLKGSLIIILVFLKKN